MPRRRSIVALIGVLVLGLAGGVAALRLLRPSRRVAIDATMAPPSPEARSAARPAQRSGSLQALVDAAAPGATVVVPPGVYRETVRITKPAHAQRERGRAARLGCVHHLVHRHRRLAVAAGRTGTRGGRHRASSPDATGRSRSSWTASRCGASTAQPGSGEFALDASRHVLLGDDPAGHVVEVTVRPAWLAITASDVTVDGLTMNDAASPAQAGGIQLEDADRVTLSHLTLQGAHGADVVIHGGQHIQPDRFGARGRRPRGPRDRGRVRRPHPGRRHPRQQHGGASTRRGRRAA